MKPALDDRENFDITVHDTQGSKTFRTKRIISSRGAEPLRGRGTRVFEAVELDKDGTPNDLPVVLKDIWIDSDRMREGDILSLLHEAAGAQDDDKLLFENYFLTAICHGDVLDGNDIPDDTAKALMRGLVIPSDLKSQFTLQWTSIFPKYAHKTHYRIVFKEVCETINSLRSLPDVMAVLDETVSGAS